MRFTYSRALRLGAGLLIVASTLVAVAAFAGGSHQASRLAPGPDEIDSLRTIEQFWTDRVTYPTGLFSQRWLLAAAASDARVSSAVPVGEKTYRRTPRSPLTLSPSAFTSLGPKPQNSETCQDPCFTFGRVSGRVNAVAIDPVETNIAYIAPVGGGIWKTTNCCSAATTWSVVSDLPLVNTSAVDDLHIDPTNHATVYAATGDLNFGSFAMGSAGVLKSSDHGASWTVLGADVFNPVYPPAATPTFPQYQAVGKVRVDPNNGNTVVAGTKTGLYFSYNGGTDWTGPCLTNGSPAQRQDITGLIARDDGATTTLYAAVGARGYATTVQPNLGNNGANGVYSTTIPGSGCPASWTLRNTGWPAATGSGAPCGTGATCTGNPIGRIDLAIAPGNPQVIYAEVQDPSTGSCGARGCFRGLWRTTDGGANWDLRADGADLDADPCGSNSAQNWYNQALAVDPNNSNVLFLGEIDIWKSTDGGSTLTDLTCGYTLGLTGDATHVDQHALTFVPGSSSTLLAGNDGGVYVSTNANAATPAFAQMNDSLSTIEFYGGDISASFATSVTPFVVGGSQDNASAAYQWVGQTQVPGVWQQRVGGDGMYARIEPKQGLRVYMESQNGNLSRSQTGPFGVFTGATDPWEASGDRRSFVFPYEIDKHHCPDNPCGHLIAGSYRVFETVTGGLTGAAWYANSLDLTKNTLVDRSFINQLAYSYTDNSVAIVGTNDGNVQYGFGLGTGVANSATWVNVTEGNTALPNRPILDVVTDTVNPLVGYAAVGGFNENTPATPGHVFQVTCTASCATRTWLNKTGNLPNIPVDSIVVNPNYPQQVFAGTDWGLYFTNNITVGSPAWYRFDGGLPHTMVWDMSIDRGATTLAVFTRGRGAYAWPLPNTDIPTAVVVSGFTASVSSRGSAVLTWRTASERDVLGFNVWRATGKKSAKVNRTLIASHGGIGGTTYRLRDHRVRPGGVYTYRLQVVAANGGRAWRAATTIRAVGSR